MRLAFHSIAFITLRFAKLVAEAAIDLMVRCSPDIPECSASTKILKTPRVVSALTDADYQPT
jgi:hypothetical protein